MRERDIDKLINRVSEPLRGKLAEIKRFQCRVHDALEKLIISEEFQQMEKDAEMWRKEKNNLDYIFNVCNIRGKRIDEAFREMEEEIKRLKEEER